MGALAELSYPVSHASFRFPTHAGLKTPSYAEGMSIMVSVFQRYSHLNSIVKGTVFQPESMQC